jgi:hydrogenase maturation protease
MTQSSKVLVAGLGSAHGDDQAGWLAAEKLAAQFRDDQDVIVRKAAIPLDVLDWLEGIEILHVCDACEATHGHSKLHRFTWVAGQLVHADNSIDSDRHATLRTLRSAGSHDFGLPDVLRLAAEIRQLPQQVVIWAIEGTGFQPEDTMTDETRSEVSRAVVEILKELRTCNA